MIRKIILIVLGFLFAVVAVGVILFYVRGPFAGFPGSRTADGSRAVTDGGVKITGWNGEVDPAEEKAGMSIRDARLSQEGDSLHGSAESGNAVFAVGGFAGRQKEWVALEPLWLDALPKGIDHFHATDYFGRHGQFTDMDIPDRMALLDRLTDLVLHRNIKLVAGAMDVPAYQAVSPKLFENEFLGNKYAGTFGAPVEYACQLMNKPGEPMPHEVDDQCDFFIEQNEYTPSAFRMLDNIRNDEIIWWHKRIGNLTPGTKSGQLAIPLLQVADLGAFLAAKKVAAAPDGKIPWSKYYEKPEKAKRIFHIMHVDDRSIKLMKGLDERIR